MPSPPVFSGDMDAPSRVMWLRVALLVCGITCLAIWPLMVLWPSGFRWNPHGSHSEMMIVVIYAVLGLFLLRAVRDPLAHRSLIWFTVWSSVAHGALMAWQALKDPSEHAHLFGDVPFLFAGAVLLGILTPLSRARNASDPPSAAPSGSD